MFIYGIILKAAIFLKLSKHDVNPHDTSFN